MILGYVLAMTVDVWREQPEAAFWLITRAARHAILDVVVALGAEDDERSMVASARLRWAVAAAAEIARSHLDHDIEVGRALDELRRQSQKWLGYEPRTLPASAIQRLASRLTSRGSHDVAAERSMLESLNLDDLALNDVCIRSAALTVVSARRASFARVDATRAILSHCHFYAAAFRSAIFDFTLLDDSDFSRSTLTNSRWCGAVVNRSSFIDATLANATIDGAVFSHCDLRGVDFAALPKQRAAVLRAVRFEHCDLRETRWSGRDIDAAAFIDCKMHAVHGTPTLCNVEIQDPDLSPGADGSHLGTPTEVVDLWKASGGHHLATQSWRRTRGG